jgi:acyl-CoA thioesterase
MTPHHRDFTSDVALTRRGTTRFLGVVAPHWWVDRGAHGGFLAAVALNAAIQTVDDPNRPPCSLTTHFLRPAAVGEVEVSVAVERSGRRLTNCLVRLEQDGQPVVLSLIAFASPRPAKSSFDSTRFPSAPPPDGLEPLPVEADGLPPFMGNFEFRFALGNLPFSGADERSCAVWMKTLAPRPPDPLAIVAFADAWAPTPFIATTEPAAAPTVDLTVHFRDHSWYEHAGADEHVLASFRSELLREGVFEERGELWSRGGRLLAQSIQLGLLIQ